MKIDLINYKMHCEVKSIQSKGYVMKVSQIHVNIKVLQ